MRNRSNFNKKAVAETFLKRYVQLLSQMPGPIFPFLLLFTPLASRSSPDESDDAEHSKWDEPRLSPDLGVEGGFRFITKA